MATNRDSTWEVVDGVQRLSTIVNFCAEHEVRENLLNEGEPLRLCGLQKLSSLNGKTFSELPKSIQLGFQTRNIRITTLNDRSDLSVRFDLFERLNSGGVKLEPQEIRNCVYRGAFNDLLKELAKNHNFRKLVKVAASDRTNGTYEDMVLRFFAFLARYKKSEHSVNDFLNEYMEYANKESPEKSTLDAFEKTIQFVASELPHGITRGRGKTPVNLFEAITVGTGLVFLSGKQPKTGVLKALLTDPILKQLTSGGTNSKKMVIGRVEFVRDRVK